MTLTAWRRRFQASLQAWADFLWPPSPDRVRQEQEAAVSAELHRRQQRMLRIRLRLERWQGQLGLLAREEQQLTLTLERLMQDGKDQEAYAAALALECLRKKRERLQDRLGRGEAVYQQQRDRFDMVKQQRLVQPDG